MLRYLVLLLIFAAVACSVPGPSEPVAQITAKQAQWREKNIHHYRISVMKVNAIWHAQTNTITVRDDMVEAQSATCTPAPAEGRSCAVQPFAADEYTVAGLFATALRLAPESGKYQLRVTFDDMYAFPKFISSDQKEVVDDETSWQVTAFESLP